MRYVFLIYLDMPTHEARPEAEIKAGMAAHTPYIERLRRNGKYVASDALGAPRAARTLRCEGGKPLVTAGPFAESREQLGGFYIVDAKDLDEAILLASNCPALERHGIAIEIGPIPIAGTDATAEGPGGCETRYLLAFYRAEADEAHDDAGRQVASTAWRSFIEHLRTAGRFAGAGALSPSASATTLRLRDGKVVLADGPFAEGRHQLARYCIVWAAGIDEASSVASECPDASRHAIEVRPIRIPVT